jgi:hypothetical protein
VGIDPRLDEAAIQPRCELHDRDDWKRTRLDLLRSSEGICVLIAVDVIPDTFAAAARVAGTKADASAAR